jgi:50S ribosomal protein L16 3-hydroxylase
MAELSQQELLFGFNCAENVLMEINQPLTLLGGLTPAAFMRRHWQKKPLLIRQAIKGFVPPVGRSDLVAMAASVDVQSRLVMRSDSNGVQGWKLRHGPFERRSLLPFKRPGWTLLVQGVDLFDDQMHALRNQFDFIPSSRLDDVMVSYATDQGGVGPHFDSYDVFLLQAHGQRRWQIGRQKDWSLRPDVPLKVLANFEPELEMVLHPGDMLYLPPRYAHDGVAMGECMTYSIGFRSPIRGDLAGELLQRLAEAVAHEGSDILYQDPGQAATARPGEIPEKMAKFACDAVKYAMRDPAAVARVLGEYLTEPKASVIFSAGPEASAQGTLRLQRSSRMLYDEEHVFINGESFRAGGRDAELMRELADQRALNEQSARCLSNGTKALVADWVAAGWLYVES